MRFNLLFRRVNEEEEEREIMKIEVEKNVLPEFGWVDVRNAIHIFYFIHVEHISMEMVAGWLADCR